MLGRKFGRLSVIRFVGVNKHRIKLWECSCDCGNLTIVRGTTLRSGMTKSCGCFQKTHAKTHGLSRSGCPEYRVWAGMLFRCNSELASGYHNYGGRGIKVCDRWQSFENFFIDMGKRPSPKHSIDRIDNNKDYSPDNCRWATKKQQDRNRRTNRIVEINEIAKPLIEWAEAVGLHPAVLTYRLDHGWTVEEALHVPSGGKR